MSTPLLLLQDISYTLGGKPLLDNASLSIAAGERVCLVGRNGSGKSTLLKITVGQQHADSGNIFLQPGTSVQYLSQEPDLSGYNTTLDYVCSVLPNPEDHYRARILLSALGLEGDENPKNLSGGEARRCALAKALAPKPDLLLLDEPTNHLDLPAIEWLESELKSLSSAMIIISHDRRFLENMANGIIWIDRGQIRQLNQKFSQFEIWKEEFFEQEAVEHHKLNRQIAREEDWVRYGVTARRKRNVRRMAELADLRQKRQDIVKNPSMSSLQASQADISGKLVVVAEQLNKSYGDQIIIKNLDLRILRGDRLGIVGPNGAGKTTLLRVLTGQEPPDSGEIKIGSNLEINTLDQQRNLLDPNKTLAQTLTSGSGDYVQVGGEKKHVVGYMKEFMFNPEQAKTPVHALSGGEKARLLLACALAKPSNVLILDEPTNDLDLETLDLLQELLASYPGTVLVVSHDRDFLDRVATSTLIAGGNGEWIEYAGGYSDMMALRKQSQKDVEPIKQNSNNKSNTSSKPTKGKSQKLSYKDQFELDHLPEKLEKLNTQIELLNQKLADPSLYEKDLKAFHTYTEQLTKAHQDHHQMEERWLELEMLQEELKQ
ncbi:ABC-F family ATP-binding cassette domain-containing protein [Commensalibacter oyaizuii]|uniref:ATP-binding protein Uup n=1 Tax=Commensalibacter oyaizuii TaxID=3043873 RepID=A0ABT6PZ55_9PROT|nr:ABC-F family ATP-binding cassette domain-containing protein [Commensalibacter sp. TBRC 16381]MDI2090128.1 ABC-F family ATP-binding cassette domain-containing protein [Commensalibacter sp. TBRC 16381]